MEAGRRTFGGVTASVNYMTLRTAKTNSKDTHLPVVSDEDRGCSQVVTHCAIPNEMSKEKLVQKSYDKSGVFSRRKQTQRSTSVDRNEEYALAQYVIDNSSLYHDGLFRNLYSAANESKENVEILRILRIEFLKALYVDAKRYCDRGLPGEIPGTTDQKNNQMWRSERAIRLTASKAKLFADANHVTFGAVLKHHLWNVKEFPETYGLLWENKAVDDYLLRAHNDDETVTVKKTGMWINPAFPQLACSPDGIVLSKVNPPRLLEIKCPPIFEGGDVLQFEKYLDKNLPSKTFYLGRKADGSPYLKRNNAYFYQLQVSMAILNMHESDFVVWGHKGHFVDRIIFDPKWWEKTKNLLIRRHAEILVPEYFLQRVPRGLPPIQLPFNDTLLPYFKSLFNLCN